MSLGEKVKVTRYFVPALATVAVLNLVAMRVIGGERSATSSEEGVALAIIYDTSGSMINPVKDNRGQMTPKHVIARRSLAAVINHVEHFVTNANPGPARQVQTGLIVFRNGKAVTAVNLGNFNPGAMRQATDQLTRPAGGTPLGNAARLGANAVLNSNLNRKHVLVITDGENTVGPDPAAVLPQLLREAGQRKQSLFFHFVAFDVEAKVFDAVKKSGATVVGAADEKQLNEQLEFIIEKKVLLEAETPPPTGKK